MIKITGLSVHVPDRVVSNLEICDKVNAEKSILDDELLHKVFGINHRRYASKNTVASDLAYKAALPIVQEVGAEKIDFMIFSAACSDLIEPATCNIVQQKLGLTCPAMDLKNACNSVVSAIHTASAYVLAGIYSNVLIVCGEKLSDAIDYKIKDQQHLKLAISGFTLGDAGAALLISKSIDSSGMVYQKFLTSGKHWDLCTIKGGGSMYPHDSTKNFFLCDSKALREALVTESGDFIKGCFAEAGWSINDVDHIITHQVSSNTFSVICDAIGADKTKCIETFSEYGNVASASIPMALNHGIQSKKIKRGQRVAIIGLAAGVSASVQLMIW